MTWGRKIRSLATPVQLPKSYTMLPNPQVLATEIVKKMDNNVEVAIRVWISEAPEVSKAMPSMAQVGSRLNSTTSSAKIAHKVV